MVRNDFVSLCFSVHSRRCAAFAGYGSTFHVFSDPHPKLELLRRLSASSPASSAGAPSVESTVACIPMRNVAAISAGLARGNDSASMEASTRWPPLPTVDQAISLMQGGCDGYACVQPRQVRFAFKLIERVRVQVGDSASSICSTADHHGAAASSGAVAALRYVGYDVAATRRVRGTAAERTKRDQPAAVRCNEPAAAGATQCVCFMSTPN